MGRAQALPNEKERKKAMKSYDVYLVWYKCDLGRALWACILPKKKLKTL